MKQQWRKFLGVHINTGEERNICASILQKVCLIDLLFEIKVWQNYLRGWQPEEDKGTAEIAWVKNGSLKNTYESQKWKLKEPHFHHLCRHIIPLFFCAEFPPLTQTTSSDYPLTRLKGTYTFIRSKIIYNFQVEKSLPGLTLLENSGSCPPIWIHCPLCPGLNKGLQFLSGHN